MKRVVAGKAVKLGGETLPINTRDKPGQGCYMEILQALKGQMDAMLAHHARVLFVRIDLKPPSFTDDNEPMRRFMRKLTKRLKRRYGFSRVGYLWAREIERSKKQHYHLALMLDARVIHHPASIIELAEEIAEGWGWGKTFTPKNCYYQITRDDPASYAEAFKRGSYLAKQRGKGYKAKTANDFATSRIKPPQSAQNDAQADLMAYPLGLYAHTVKTPPERLQSAAA